MARERVDSAAHDSRAARLPPAHVRADREAESLHETLDRALPFCTRICTRIFTRFVRFETRRPLSSQSLQTLVRLLSSLRTRAVHDAAAGRFAAALLVAELPAGAAAAVDARHNRTRTHPRVPSNLQYVTLKRSEVKWCKSMRCVRDVTRRDAT